MSGVIAIRLRPILGAKAQRKDPRLMEQGNVQSRVVAAAAEQTEPKPLPGLWECITGSGMARAGGAALVLILQVYQNRLGVRPEIVGLVSVAFYLTELTGAPIFGAWADRRGWRLFLLLGPLLSALAAALTWSTTLLALPLALPLLFAARLLMGAGIASNVPATLSFISAASGNDPVRRARAVSWFELATIGGTALGGVMGAMLFERFNTGSFLAVALFYVLCWGLLLRVPDREAAKGAVAEGHESHPSILRMLRRRDLWRFAPAWIAVNAILGVWLNNFASQLTLPCANPTSHHTAALCSRIGHQFLVGDYSAMTAGSIFSAFALVFSVGIVLWSLRLGSMSPTRAMQISLGGAVALCALVVGINHLSSPALLPLAGLSLLTALALMVLSGFTPAALSMLVDLAERHSEDRGSTMGIYSVLLGVGQFIGGSLGGVFAGWMGVDGLAVLTLAFTLISIGCVLLIREQ
jgi:MFS family permease